MRCRPQRISLILLVGFGLCIGPSDLSAQAIRPAVYFGLGMGTNIGGSIGIGTEVHVSDRISFNVAAGVMPDALREEGLRGSPFDFDVGVKWYPLASPFFAGLNYGIIYEEFFVRGRPDDLVLHKVRGFTASLGARVPVTYGFYLSGFAGVTSSGYANHVRIFDTEKFVPHFGLLVGYDLDALRGDE